MDLEDVVAPGLRNRHGHALGVVVHALADLVDLAGLPLLARITRKSAAELAIHPGQHLIAPLKAVALLE